MHTNGNQLLGYGLQQHCYLSCFGDINYAGIQGDF